MSIKEYLLADMERLYSGFTETAAKFNTTYESVRHMARRLRQGTTRPESKVEPVEEPIENKTSSFKENFETGEANLSFTTNTRIKTKEDLIAAGMLDLKDFEILSYEVGTWEGYRKDKKASLTWSGGVMNGYVEDSGNLKIETLYRVNVKLRRRTLDNDLEKQKALILQQIKEESPVKDYDKAFSQLQSRIGNINKDQRYLLELCLFDFHWGKFAWAAETGEDFDLKIAEERFKSAVTSLLRRVDLTSVERILFPIGNDMINIDNKNHTTTAGTPQDTDTRFMKIIQVVRRVLVEVINELNIIAPVDVIVVPGNHDATSSFLIGEILDAFYHHNPIVMVNNEPRTRKYYTYGLNAIMLSHGNEEKHGDLGLIFATEQPTLWAATQYRFCQLGHYHKNKTISYLSIDEQRGFQVQILPSLSGTDAWHFRKGYMSKKQAKAFMYHATEGLVGEYTVTV